MPNRPSAVINLNKRTSRYEKVIIIIIVMTTIVIGTLFVLSRQQLRDIQIVRQELQTTQVSEQNLATLNQFVDENTQNIENLYRTFPTNEEILEVIKNLETVVQSYDPQGTVSIGVATPTKFKNELHIPLRIVLDASVTDFTMLLREFEKLPYIVEIATVELNTTNPANYKINIGARLYVADPFNQ